MLQPKKTKFRRQQKGRQKGNAQRGNQLAFGSFGIKALETKWITGRQIEAARIAVTRYMQRQGQIWIRIFPDKPITRKPADVRMGKGKGAPEGFVAPVTPGRIIIEAEGVSYEIAKEALRLAAQKLPITTKFDARKDHFICSQYLFPVSGNDRIFTNTLQSFFHTFQVTGIVINNRYHRFLSPLKFKNISAICQRIYIYTYHMI